MEYKYQWYIPDAYLHSRGTGYFTSHEGCAFINETDRDAHVRFTFYFQDREPMTGYTSVVPARRTKHARFDLMENDKGEPVPMNVGYAVVVESDMDNWDPVDDERMMMALYYSEQVHPYPRYKNDLEKFKTDWAGQTYDPAAVLCFPPEDVEEIEVMCEEIIPPDPPEPPARPRKKKKKARRRK